MSDRHHRAFGRIASAIDAATRGRRWLAERAKHIAAVELSTLLDADAAIRAEVSELHAEVARRRDREAALQDALVATQRERDQARADVQRMSRGLVGLPMDAPDGVPVPRIWN